MLYIQSAWEMIAIDISEGVAVYVDWNLDERGDIADENLVITTTTIRYIFEKIGTASFWANALADKIIEERKKETIVINMNALKREVGCDLSLLEEFSPNSIEVKRI